MCAKRSDISYEEAKKHPSWRKLEEAERELNKTAERLGVYNKNGNFKKVSPDKQAEWDRVYAAYNTLRNKIHKEVGYGV